MSFIFCNISGKTIQSFLCSYHLYFILCWNNIIFYILYLSIYKFYCILIQNYLKYFVYEAICHLTDRYNLFYIILCKDSETLLIFKCVIQISTCWLLALSLFETRSWSCLTCPVASLNLALRLSSTFTCSSILDFSALLDFSVRTNSPCFWISLSNSDVSLDVVEGGTSLVVAAAAGLG